MGNNNATPSLREEERSKLETRGKSPLESVSLETTQEHVLLAGQGKDGVKEKESFLDGNISKETPEREPQSNELVKDAKLKTDEKQRHQSSLESTVMKTDENLQTQTSVTEEVEELSVVSKLKPKESGNEEKPSLVDDIVFNETVEKEEKKMNNESRDKIVPAEEVLNLEHRGVVDDDVSIEGKADKVSSKPSLKELNTIQETGLEIYEEEKDKELRSIPVSYNDGVTGDSMVQELVSEVASSSRNKMGLEKANKGQEVTEAITESNKEDRHEIRSRSFGNETTEKTPLLSQDKTETYETTVDVEMSLGLLNKHSEGDDKVKDKKGSGDDDLVDKKGRVTKRSSSSLLGTCLCCGTN